MKRRSEALWWGVVRGLLIAVVCSVATTAQARWVGEDEADIIVQRYAEQYTVRKDGTFVARFEMEKRIANETGRQNHATLRLRYNSTAESLRLLVAEVTTNGDTRPVPEEYVEDKPLASNANGFDPQNQVLVAFPDVKVGSVLHVIYEWEKHLPSLPDFFSQRVLFHRKAGTLTGETVIDSELPLEVEVNDPTKALAVEKSQPEGRYRVAIRLTKPLYEGVVDEPQGYVPLHKFTWVFASSATTYPAMAAGTRDRYDAVAKEPLPELFAAILRLAETERGPVERINAVTAALAERLRYMGDWRPREGGFVPRSLAVIADTLFGDCKDLSVSVVAILRRLGMKASVAWVWRGVEPQELPSLPGTVFNHAVVFVDLKDRSLWIDPTNFESFAQGVPADIAGRKALVLGDRIDLRAIPGGEPADAVFDSRVRVAFRPNHRAKLEQRLTHKGWAAVSLTGRQLRESRASIERYLASTLFDEGQLLSYRVDPFELSSRIVRDRSYRFTAELNQAYTRTSAGYAFMFPKSNVVEEILGIKGEKRISSHLLGKPYTLRRTVRLDHLRVVGEQLKGCKIASPWLDATRKYRPEGKSLIVDDEYLLKRNLLTNDEMRSKTFGEMQEHLRECFDRIAVVFRLTPEARALPATQVEPDDGWGRDADSLGPDEARLPTSTSERLSGDRAEGP